MNLPITFALVAFGFAAFIPGQGVSKAPQEKDGKQILLQATASPTRLDFGDQVVQTMSKPLRVTLTNTTDKSIEIRRVGMSEEHGEDFVVDDDEVECTDVALQAGKSCSVGVVFFPLIVGERTSILLVTYDDPDHPQKIFLKGIGIKSTTQSTQ